MPTRVLILPDQFAATPPQRRRIRFFGCSRNAAADFENCLRAAVSEWSVANGISEFDWACDLDRVPARVWRRHGLALRASSFDATQTLVLDPGAPAGDDHAAGSRAARALTLAQHATTACPYCGSFESVLLSRSDPCRTRHDAGRGALEWRERRSCNRCGNDYDVWNADC